MKKALFLFAAAIPALAQQNFDFKTLDKLGANAKESSNISLDGDMIKAAGGLIDGDQSEKHPDSIKPLLDKLKGVYIRSFEYAQPGQYNDADLEPFRAWLQSLQWSKIIDVKGEKENTQMYFQVSSSTQSGGFAIVSAEPKEVSIILIMGNVSMSDLGKLNGKLGIPDMTITHGGKKADK
jgi:Domain of unknown function (DUF4252)